MAIRVGIAGACRRGGSFAAGLRAAGFRVTAVCDVDAEGLPAAAARMGAHLQYLDYERMLDEAGIDAVVIGTPMQYHASMAIAALERGIHVLSEVPAAVSLDECRALVRASTASTASTAAYMMAENYLYRKDNVLVTALVRRGLFGQVYYAEGEYVHEVKELNEDTPWRRTWQTGIAGVTYGTHSLGPILQWMPGDRVAEVCCADTEVRLRDPRGDEYAQMTPVMLCRTARGALIKIHEAMDMTLPGLISQQSVRDDGRWLPVPDSRDW